MADDEEDDPVVAEVCLCQHTEIYTTKQHNEAVVVFTTHLSDIRDFLKG